MKSHDPTTQVGYLHQCLSNARRPIGLFLGAGCPMAVDGLASEPLIPDIAGITKSVCESLNDSGTLATVMGNLEEDGMSQPTVEDILTHVRGLRAVAGAGAVRGLSSSQLDQLDTGICELIQTIVHKDLPTAATPYHSLASWIKATERAHPVEVFTTNYDLLMEQALEHSEVPYFDGFVGGLKPSFDVQAMEDDKLPARWARLWKLHGSINWHRDHRGRVLRSAPEGRSPVIHPSHLKYQESRRLPYLAMMDRLRKYLSQPSAILTICGYSFRDQHVNDVIVQGLHSSHTTMALALQFNSLRDSPDAVAIAREQPNLTVLARDGAVIGTNQGRWIKRDKKDASPSASPGVVWTQLAPPDDGSKLEAELLLGNFADLGSLLQHIVGDTPQQSSESNGN